MRRPYWCIRLGTYSSLRHSRVILVLRPVGYPRASFPIELVKISGVANRAVNNLVVTRLILRYRPPPPKPVIFLNERFMAARHEE